MKYEKSLNLSSTCIKYSLKYKVYYVQCVFMPLFPFQIPPFWTFLKRPLKTERPEFQWRHNFQTYARGTKGIIVYSFGKDCWFFLWITMSSSNSDSVEDLKELSWECWDICKLISYDFERFATFDSESKVQKVLQLKKQVIVLVRVPMWWMQTDE